MKILRFEAENFFFLQEFMIGTDMCGAGDPDRKLRWVAKLNWEIIRRALKHKRQYN